MPSHVISIFGPKAGVGKTIFATNFALALERASRSRILLIDLDPHDCGDVALLLGVNAARTIADLAPQSHKLTKELIQAGVHAYSDRIFILPAAKNGRQMSSLDPVQIGRVLDALRANFDYLIIDCGSDIHPLTVTSFEISSLVLFLTKPEILPLARSVHSLADLKALAFPSDLIQIIVNEYDPGGVITEPIVRQKLRKPCLALLPPEFEAIERSIHEGVPIFRSAPRAPYSQVMEELARAILTQGILRSTEKIKLKGPAASATHTIISEAGQKRLYGKQLDEEADRQADLRNRIHQRLIDVMDFRTLSAEELNKKDEKSREELRDRTRETIIGIIDRMPEIATREDRQRVAKEVLDEALGLGPLEDLLADSDVNEILVNRKDQIYVERSGKLVLTNCRFTSDKHLLGVIERIVAPIGRRIDEKTPMVDARLPDGSRVHAIIPPLALDGPMLTIRKFSQKVLGPSHLVKLETLSDEMADFLRACVEARINIIISGGTGTGKTTLLNILSSYIPARERIITVEDAAELRLPQEHVGRLEARPPNLQGEGAIPIRELVRNTLRMRPDRIIVGECRGAEALDMLQAMNTGHDGSMTTIHANSPRDCMGRLETLVMFAGFDLPSRAIREQISSAIQLVVQLDRMSDGKRKIVAITEVTGVEGSNIQLQDLFVFKQKGLESDGRTLGKFQPTGLAPTFLERFTNLGIALPSIFRGNRS